MHLSTRGRYAVMAMLDLAEMQHPNGDTRRTIPVTLAQIADRQSISLSYLEQLFARLRKNGLVKSVRGPGGGYILAKSPNNTWLNDIIHAVNEPMGVTRCGVSEMGRKAEKGCVSGKQCNGHDLWVALGNHIELFMKNVNLHMVLEGDIKDSIPVLLCEPNREVVTRVRIADATVC
ncbi:MAG: Rrf2 family transcriptional regulator [Proteobacteria bacterium]|nr:Rrf2 family transcriptional regulator [Pseudomonadota bacterium]